MSADLNSAAMDAIRKACNEIMGGNCAFIDDDFARCLYTMKEQRDALQKRCELLTAAINEALEYFEDREDVVDGDYGEPAPNREMALAQVLRAALENAHG
jgi:hypothetical protein